MGPGCSTKSSKAADWSSYSPTVLILMVAIWEKVWRQKHLSVCLLMFLFFVNRQIDIATIFGAWFDQSYRESRSHHVMFHNESQECFRRWSIERHVIDHLKKWRNTFFRLKNGENLPPPHKKKNKPGNQPLIETGNHRQHLCSSNLT